jgi:beta-lactamase superfamily II metal-dependent hydrolase
MSEPIEVHVFGAKIGESMVVRLPGGVWGVVDNYTPTLKSPESNPAVRLLRERGITRLDFLCLTHPHVDHYKGMSHLLEAYRPDRVWLFGSATHRPLYSRVAEVLKAAAESKNVGMDDSEHVDELVSILDRIQTDYADSNRMPRLEVRRLQLEMPLLELNSTPPVRITALGASGGRALEYERTLVRCFALDGKCLVDELPRVDHNMISGGLLIEYGESRIVLGGDIDTEAWQETMRTFPSGRLNSSLVKVSHHGSATGYCAGLWQQFSPGKTAIAVITPYSRQGLPSAEGLKHISGHARATLSASVRAAALATDWSKTALDTRFQGVSADALVTLRALFPKASHPAERLEGVCSFVVAHDGSLTTTYTGQAGKLC